MEISVKDLNENFFRAIGDEWMLITAGNKEGFNTMTASWGTIGELWSLPVAICFVRPQRYTFKFMEDHDYYTLCFFKPEHHDILQFCGSNSGREVVDILPHLKERDSTGFYEALDSTSSRVPAGSCCRPLLRFAAQVIPVCPTVKIFIAAFTSAFSS